MDRKPSKISNPYSSGGGGSNFETRVQAAFTIIMLSGSRVPCIPYPIKKIFLQAKYKGYETDDMVISAEHPETGQEFKLLAQIKHSVGVTKSDNNFGETLQRAWSDYNYEKFCPETDAIALITGPLSKSDMTIKAILEWARYSDNEEEFEHKINTPHFSSQNKKYKVDVFKYHLKQANNNSEVTAKELWQFLRVFYILGYDLDCSSGSTLSLLYSLISSHTDKDPSYVWTEVLNYVQSANQSSGTITMDIVPNDIKSQFKSSVSSSKRKDILRLEEHGKVILEKLKTTIGGVHIPQPGLIAELIDMTNSSDFVLISGERGCGKSSLVKVFVDSALADSSLFCLRTEELDKPHINEVLSAIRVSCSLSDLESELALIDNKYLIIESLEKLLEFDNTKSFTDLLRLINKQQGWTVIATCRDYAVQQICFNYLDAMKIDYKRLEVKEFSDEQVQLLCNQIKLLSTLSQNPELFKLIKKPFFADLAFRVLQTGETFKASDGEREFKESVWKNVISKESNRKDGMPLKRKQTFVEIAQQRAKLMTYGVPDDSFDANVLLKLEEDGLVLHENNTVILAHDVLEDWAIEYYIDLEFNKSSGKPEFFLKSIGSEPAINRAYRLWLHQKLRYKEKMDDYILDILTSKTIDQCWQDETITAILMGDDPYKFFELLAENLFLNDGVFIRRFMMMLRVACRITVNQEYTDKIISDPKLAYYPLLVPCGEGWSGVIKFLSNNKEKIKKVVIPDVIAVLKDWITLISINTPLHNNIGEVGHLAIYLLNKITESYSEGKNRRELISIIVQTSSAISGEFLSFIDDNVFANDKMSHYKREIVEVAFSFIESTYLCKSFPVLVLKLVPFLWMKQENDHDNRYRSIDLIDYFGMHNHRVVFYPASGMKGPFRNMLSMHRSKGLNLILILVNKAAEKYAHSSLDAQSSNNVKVLEPPDLLINRITIKLNDGSTVKQYCSSLLWNAYRGKGAVPNILKCALMALENWLINLAESGNVDRLAEIYNFVLQNSNSVMTTAVLASVATGYPSKVGKAALPLLSSIELYYLDSERAVHDGGKISIDPFYRSQDPYQELYRKDREIANKRPWRKEHLETLAIKLQFSLLKDDVFTVIDYLRSNYSNNQLNRFMFHRIDTRVSKMEKDEKNRGYILSPNVMDQDLLELQQKNQVQVDLVDRFSALTVWAGKKFDRETIENESFDDWRSALGDAKELEADLNNDLIKGFTGLCYSGIITLASLLIRDHLEELTEEDKYWCKDKIISYALKHIKLMDYNELLSISSVNAPLNILPLLLDTVHEKEEEMEINELLFTSLLDSDKDIRESVATGIREYLWQRNTLYTQNCIRGLIEWSKVEKEMQIKRLSGDEVISIKNKLIHKIINCQLPDNSANINLQTHNLHHIIIACLMIPYGSIATEHLQLITRTMNLLYLVEGKQDVEDYNTDETIDEYFDHSLMFIKWLAKYLYKTYEAGIANSDIKQALILGCDKAPRLLDNLFTCLAVETENEGKIEIFWKIWNQLSTTVQEMAVKISGVVIKHNSIGDMKKLLRTFLKADVPRQPIDFEKQHIAYGKELILEFVFNVGNNPIVFSAMARLMYYFHNIFFERGVHLLAKHQNEVEGLHLFSEIYTVFYLEASVSRYLFHEETGTLSRKMYEACMVLLNSLVENGSPRAFFIREHLIRSRMVQ